MPVLLSCVCTLGVGRIMAMHTSSLAVVYAVMGLVIISLGVVNTIMSAACTVIAEKDQVGGLFGVMEAVESIAGLVGPTIGGLLYRVDPNLPILSVVAIYALVFLCTLGFYKKHILEFHTTYRGADKHGDKLKAS